MSSSIDEIQVFVKVVEEGGFTAASGVLSMPKSTISRNISRLEDRLGVRLLYRTTRQLRTTEVGQAYYERCVRIVAELAEAEEAITAMSATPRGPLRLTAPVSYGHLYLSEVLSAFLKCYPEVQLQVSLTDRKVDLIEEGFDVAIRGGVLEDSSLIARKLSGAARVICASPDYLARRGTPASPADLRSHDCLMYGLGGGKTWRLAGGESVTVSGPLLVNNLDVIRQCAVDGLGLAMMPRFIAEDELATGALVAVLEQHASLAGGLYVLYPHARHLSAKVRAFVDFVTEHLRSTSPHG